MRFNRRRPGSSSSRLAVLSIMACVLAAGCTSSIVDYETRTHVVQPGETLYDIAWRYRLDHQQLARLNGLSNPDLIYVGQRLTLRGMLGSSGSAPGRSSGSADTTPALPAPQFLPPPMWQWPVSGQVVQSFGADSGLGNGIAIRGAAGDSVMAAASGRVVYAGNGLIGYGQLVIIKHNETFLSAYGHNRRLIVRQGDDVSRGQLIAEMGTGPEQRPQLHFEIRRNGVPEDPLGYLPR